jgi:hypothetical protein
VAVAVESPEASVFNDAFAVTCRDTRDVGPELLQRASALRALVRSEGLDQDDILLALSYVIEPSSEGEKSWQSADVEQACFALELVSALGWKVSIT